MTSHFYVENIYYQLIIFRCFFHTEIWWEKTSFVDGFSIWFDENSEVANFLGVILYWLSFFREATKCVTTDVDRDWPIIICTPGWTIWLIVSLLLSTARRQTSDCNMKTHLPSVDALRCMQYITSQHRSTLLLWLQYIYITKLFLQHQQETRIYDYNIFKAFFYFDKL